MNVGTSIWAVSSLYFLVLLGSQSSWVINYFSILLFEYDTFGRVNDEKRRYVVGFVGHCCLYWACFDPRTLFVFSFEVSCSTGFADFEMPTT